MGKALTQKELDKKTKAVKEKFKPSMGKDNKTKDLPNMPEKDELYKAGENLFYARQALSDANEQNEKAANEFIEVAKKLKKSSITVHPENEVPRTFKYEKSTVKEKVTMRQEK